MILSESWSAEEELEHLIEKLEKLERRAENLLQLKIEYYSKMAAESPIAATRERCERELEKLATESVDYTENDS